MSKTSSLQTVLDAAAKWRDELEGDIADFADTQDDRNGYVAEAANITAALAQLQPMNIYLLGDDQGPDMFGTIFDTEDDALDLAEDTAVVWRVPVTPDRDAAEKVTAE